MQRLFWRLLQLIALGLLAACPLIGAKLDKPTAGWVGMLLILALHAAELPIALPLANEKGLSNREAWLKNALFGFTWWLPLKRGIFQR